MIKIKIKNGYSLVEVLVAFAVLVVGIVPILSMYPQIFTIIQKSTENEERSRIALQVIEYIKVGGYPSLLDHVDTDGDIKTDTIALTPIAPGSKSYTNTAFRDDFLRRRIDGNFELVGDFFRLSSKKGMDLANARIYYAIANTQVHMVEGGNENVMYDNFIVGTVIVGTGKVVTGNITEREKETRMQFIVTPIE